MRSSNDGDSTRSKSWLTTSVEPGEFANALRDVPLRELKDLGGWKSERTVVAVYLRPDEQAQRTALGKLATNGQ
jgi:hypothetical protein